MMAVPGQSAVLVLKMDFVMLNTALKHENLSGLAKYLVQDGLLTAASIPLLLETCSQQKISLITHLVRTNILSSDSILACCAKHFSLPVFDLNSHDENLKTHLNPELMLRYRIVPISCNQNTLHIGMSDPTDITTLSALRFQTGLTISPMLVCEAKLDKILANLNRLTPQLEQAISKIKPIEDASSHYTLTEPDDGPISKFVAKLLDDAILQGVSDIHIEPFPQFCRLRFRRDGLLYEVATTPPHFATRVITRLKIMAHLNIAERRLPQDGRLQHCGMDIRINTCPTLSGEKMVLRLLNASKMKLDMNALGLTDVQQELFLDKLTQPQGLILVTGPTGSGKTITLYSALHFLNQIEKNISSVEDPVEIEFTGINQVNVNARIGLDFASVLRSLLRQDPDIIMIGEIRDAQTAAIAIQAAQTGHLVLSTLHTNNAMETITRLQSMNIASHHINTISLIIAQRLVRKLCVHCKKISHQHAFTSYVPVGCHHCYQGYHERIAIFELMQLHEENQMSLREAGMLLVQQGITSYAELLRVIGKE